MTEFPLVGQLLPKLTDKRQQPLLLVASDILCWPQCVRAGLSPTSNKVITFVWH